MTGIENGFRWEIIKHEYEGFDRYEFKVFLPENRMGWGIGDDYEWAMEKIKEQVKEWL